MKKKAMKNDNCNKNQKVRELIFISSLALKFKNYPYIFEKIFNLFLKQEKKLKKYKKAKSIPFLDVFTLLSSLCKVKKELLKDLMIIFKFEGKVAY